MSNFTDLLRAEQAVHPEHRTLLRVLNNEDAQHELETFFDSYGFKELAFLGAGDGALVFYDAANPEIAFRLAPNIGNSFQRACIPYVIQPLYTKNDFNELIDTKLEILPKLDDPTDEEFDPLYREFVQEVRATNTNGDIRGDDLRVFKYPDPYARGSYKQVLMATDDSVFDATVYKEPKCTANYPSLAIQQAEQQKLWDADERLQQLLPDGPAKLPDTRIIPTTQREDRPPGLK